MGSFGLPNSYGAVVADDHVLEPQQQLGRERLAGQVGRLLDLVAEHLHAHDQVADELPLVGVGEGAVVAQLVDLADVVQEDARQQQVAVELGIEVGDPVGRRQERDDVLEQPAVVGVVVLDPRRGGGELADEVVVDQEALDQGAEVGVGEAQQAARGAARSAWRRSARSAGGSPRARPASGRRSRRARG